MKTQITQSTFFQEGGIGHRLLHYRQDRGKIVNVWFREEVTIRQLLEEIGWLEPPGVKTFHHLSIFRKQARLIGPKRGEVFVFHFPYTAPSLKRLMAMKDHLRNNSTYLLGASFLASGSSDKILYVEEDGRIVQEHAAEGFF